MSDLQPNAFDGSDASSNSSESSLVDKLMKKPESSQQINAAKSTSWCILRELYKREIGLYDKRAKWNTKYYQSEVAVQKLRLSKQLEGNTFNVNYLDFNDTGDLLASGSETCRICIWDWSRGTCRLNYEIKEHNLNIYCAKFLKTQGDICIVSCGSNGLVVLSTMNNCDVIDNKVLLHHDGDCFDLAVHHEVPFVVLSCGADGIVKNIDIRESINKIKNLLHVKTSRGINVFLYTIDINPMNPFEFILAGDDDIVTMYDKRKISDKPLKIFKRLLPAESDHTYLRGARFDFQFVTIASAVYNYCGTEILASYHFDSIYLFDINGPPNSIIHKYGGHIRNGHTFKGANFYGPRSEYVLSGSDRGGIFIWDKKTAAIVRRIQVYTRGEVDVVEGHPHMPTLAVGGSQKTVQIWEPLNEG